jgi:hypothetical protein
LILWLRRQVPDNFRRLRRLLLLRWTHFNMNNIHRLLLICSVLFHFDLLDLWRGLFLGCRLRWPLFRLLCRDFRNFRLIQYECGRLTGTRAPLQFWHGGRLLQTFAEHIFGFCLEFVVGCGRLSGRLGVSRRVLLVNEHDTLFYLPEKVCRHLGRVRGIPAKQAWTLYYGLLRPLHLFIFISFYFK